MKHVLVGVDGSAESRAAAKKGAEIAAGAKEMLRLVCVVPPIEAYTNVVSSPAELKAQHAVAAQIVNEVARDIDGVQVETQVSEGVPSKVLAELASQPEVDIVVVGHRGRGKIERLLIGSVADKLVQISPKPVLIVR